MQNSVKYSKKIGVIGLGSVGKAVKHTFEYYYENVVGYDIVGDYDWSNILETSMSFVCVSTPEGQDGRLDCSNVDDILARLSYDDYNGLVIIKSTLRVGYMDQAILKYPKLRLVYMPEFLREKSNFQWFVCPDRLVISGKGEDVEEALGYFSWVEEAEILRMSHIEAEIGKLAHNAYIAVKVSFTNEVESICREHIADPEKVMEVIHADRRVKSKEHLQPNLGPYGGKCIPKDTRELINASNNALLLRAAESVNENARKTRELYFTSQVMTPALAREHNN